MSEIFNQSFNNLKLQAVEAGKTILEQAGQEADKIFIYFFQNDCSFSVNGFFAKGQKTIRLHNDYFTDEQMKEYTNQLFEILDQMVDLCNDDGQQCPSEQKITYDFYTDTIEEEVLFEEPQESIDDRIDIWADHWMKGLPIKESSENNIISYQGITIEIDSDEAESRKHIQHDFEVLTQNDISAIIKEQFIPWLLGDQFPDRDTDKVFDGLEIFDISYHYSRVVAKYSPTKKDNFFGQFEFSFRSCSDYTEDILEAVAMEVYVLDNNIVKVDGYDI